MPGVSARISATSCGPRARSTITTSAVASREKETSGIVALIFERSIRSETSAQTRTPLRRSQLRRQGRHETGFGQRELGPALARPAGELVHQRDRVGVVVTGPDLDD